MGELALINKKFGLAKYWTKIEGVHHEFAAHPNPGILISIRSRGTYVSFGYPGAEFDSEYEVNEQILHQIAQGRDISQSEFGSHYSDLKGTDVITFYLHKGLIGFMLPEQDVSMGDSYKVYSKSNLRIIRTAGLEINEYHQKPYAPGSEVTKRATTTTILFGREHYTVHAHYDLNCTEVSDLENRCDTLLEDCIGGKEALIYALGNTVVGYEFLEESLAPMSLSDTCCSS